MPKAEITDINTGTRSKRAFDPLYEAGMKREFIIGEMPWIPIENAGPLADMFGLCAEFDFICRVDGKDATTFRADSLRRRLVDGIAGRSRPMSMEFFCPHTGEGWTVEFSVSSLTDELDTGPLDNEGTAGSLPQIEG